MIQKTYAIDGMHCTSCAMLIEGELEDIGVKAIVDYPKQTLKVTYDPRHATEASIREAVRKAGYELA